MKKLLCLYILIFTVAGCAAAMKQKIFNAPGQTIAERQAFINQNPDLPEIIKNALLEGNLFLPLINPYNYGRFVPIDESLTKSIREYFVSIRPQWPDNIKQAVLEGSVILGMTKEQVICSWGGVSDADINTTILPGTKHEQWVYGSRNYLYFENGVLSAIQD